MKPGKGIFAGGSSGFVMGTVGPQGMTGAVGPQGMTGSSPANNGWPATCMSCDSEYTEKRIGVIAGGNSNPYGICPDCAHAISVFKTFLVKENGQEG